MKRIAGAVLATGIAVLGFASAAHAGPINYTTACGPDGSTVVTLTIGNGVRIYVDDVLETSHVTPHTVQVITGPGEHKVQWFGPPTDANQVPHPELPDVLWDTKSVTVPARTDCAAAPPTTAAATTIAATPTVVTAAPPTTETPTGITFPPCPLPIFNGSAWVCPTTTTRATAIDQGALLPATGSDGDAGLLAAAGALLVIGSTLVLVRRPRRVA